MAPRRQLPARARAALWRRSALWRRIRTVDDPEWTRRYHAEDPRQKAFGGRVVLTLEDGVAIEDEIAVADAHPLGAQPFGRDDYLAKFNTLSSEYAGAAERNRFLAAALALPALPQGALQELTVEVPPQARHYEGLRPGLFEQSSR